MAQSMNITFTPGLPDEHGEYLFWMWDGMVVAGALHRNEEFGLVVTYCDLTIPDRPRPVTHRAATGKVAGYAKIKRERPE